MSNNIDPRFYNFAGSSQSNDNQYQMYGQQNFHQHQHQMPSQQQQFGQQQQFQQLQQFVRQFQMQNQFQNQQNYQQNQSFSQAPQIVPPPNPPNLSFDQQSHWTQNQHQLNQEERSWQQNQSTEEPEEHPHDEHREQTEKRSNTQKHIKSKIHCHIGWREIQLLIREFNPTKNRDLSANEWTNEIERLGKIHKWDDLQMMLYGTMMLKGIAKTWYQYSLEMISNWEDFKRELVKNFPKTADATDINSALRAKKRRTDETLEEYFHSTVKLAKKIKLNDSAIKDYLIRGLQNAKHEIILSSIGSCSLTGFLQHMLRLEKDSGQQSTYHSSSSNYKQDRSPERSTGRKRPYSPSYSPGKKDKAAKPDRIRKCFLCLSETHLVQSCPENIYKSSVNTKSDQKGDSTAKNCFICGEIGHLAKECPKCPLPTADSRVLQHENVNRRINLGDDFDLEIDDEIGDQIDEVLDLAQM
ncbi:uncharacterized protein LOC132266080 [Phlebotomus argentipes]|uniref:uncharacterized protein LOC132266080 n=1 Tax=Phlebotomus argentipes TaxID=94469 RepID=UPI0028932B50|nr:uncharacterized protein LOC132266080 [Phlebotomus argentipes]